MLTPTRLTVSLAAALALAACSNEPENTTTADMPVTADMPMAGDTPMAEGMPRSASDGKMASSQGTVTAVDPDASTITIEHGPIPEANWPAMTMGFKADEAARAKVAPGDKVDFELRLNGNSGEITRIERQ